MTNADCIRRMNDEQLYEFLSEWERGDIDYSVTFCDLCKQGGNELNLDCDGCRKHWLQRDAVDFGGLMYWKRNTTFKADQSLIQNAPTIDPVRHGYWKETDDPMFRACSVCRYLEYKCNEGNYCPECGTKMDGGTDNETD